MELCKVLWLTYCITTNKIECGFNFSFPLSLDALFLLLRVLLQVSLQQKSVSVAHRMSDAALSEHSALEGFQWHSEEAISHNICCIGVAAVHAWSAKNGI